MARDSFPKISWRGAHADVYIRKIRGAMQVLTVVEHLAQSMLYYSPSVRCSCVEALCAGPSCGTRYIFCFPFILYSFPRSYLPKPPFPPSKNTLANSGRFLPLRTYLVGSNLGMQKVGLLPLAFVIQCHLNECLRQSPYCTIRRHLDHRLCNGFAWSVADRFRAGLCILYGNYCLAPW